MNSDCCLIVLPAGQTGTCFFYYRILDQDVYRSARSTTRPLPGKTPAGETRFGIQHSQRPSILFGPAFNGHARRYSRPVEVITPALFLLDALLVRGEAPTQLKPAPPAADAWVEDYYPQAVYCRATG